MSLKKFTIGFFIVGLALAVSTPSARASQERPHLVHPISGQVPNNTYVVTKTSDSGDNTNAAAGTLRRALVDANANGGFDAIVFDIPGGGVKTITVKNYFPDISDNAGVMIDGTQSDDIIEIDGSQVNNHHGFAIVSDNNVIKGLTINGVQGGGTGIGVLNGASNNVIIGNKIGTNVAGTAAKPNHSGVYLAHNTSGNRVGGTDGVTPGGACTGECNLLSGNRFHGLVIDHSSNNLVQGNFIGVNVNGTGALLNSDDGILIAESSHNTIGGSSPQARNVVAANAYPNIEIGENGSHHNTVQGNYIGINSAGTAVIASGDTGVLVANGAHDNLIDSNVIGGNSNFGILTFKGAHKTTITNNRVGIAATTDANLGNLKKGIELQGNNNYVGNNRVGNNGSDGVRVKSGINNAIRRNEIFNNGTFGIRIGADQFKDNDPGDADTGPNNYQNFPEITAANYNGGNVTVQGKLNARPNVRHDIDLFYNAACDVVSGKNMGEGKVYLGSVTVTTNGSGNANFSIQFGGVSSSGVIASTATDSNNNTSQFSYCKTITTGVALPEAPQLLSPSNGESVGDNPPWLDWSDANGATYYTLTIRQDTKKGTKVYVNDNITASEITPDELEAGHTYYWQVRACNTAGCVKSSKNSFVIP